jgi:hypothetical protein
MATIGDAIIGAINTNWAVPTGGVKPTLANTEDVRFDYPDVTELVIALSYTLYTRVERVNDTYVDRFHTITLQAQTTDATNKEERLIEIVDEVDRILNTNGVTGFTTVKIMKKEYTPSDRSRGVYACNMHIELIERNTASATAAGSTTASTLTVDTLTVNTSIAGSPTAALGATTVTGNIAVTGTVDGVDIAAEPARITTEIDTDIATHTAIEAAHGMEHDDLTDTTLTGAYLEDLLMFGSANAAWVPFIFEVTLDGANDIGGSSLRLANEGANDSYWLFVLPLPTNKGGLKLHIADIRLDVMLADADDYVDLLLVQAVSNAGTLEVVNDTTDRTAQGEYTYAVTPDLDVSGHSLIRGRILTKQTTTDELIITGLFASCYYDT